MDEFAIISRYFQSLAKSDGAARLSDDVALLDAHDSATIITVDAIVEGVHFLPSDPVASVARKLVRVNVSDIHAKGALPVAALLTLGWPRSKPETELAAFAAALGDELDGHGMSLLGGDTVMVPDRMFLSLTVTGRCLSSGPVRRGGARVGDDVWVTGEIGHGVLGLRDARKSVDSLHAQHYREPRLAGPEAARLVAQFATASMDVSDGLLGDACRLMKASSCGCRIELDRVPRADPASDAIEQVTGGDDYQILFTAPPSMRKDLEESGRTSRLELSRIGEMTDSGILEILAAGRALQLPARLGFSHES